MTGTFDRVSGAPALDQPTVERDGEAPEGTVLAAGETGGAPGDGGAPIAHRGRTALTAALLTAVVGLPVVIATAAVRTPRWYPLVDLAQIEMRVRDVGLHHPPLVGMGGRIFGLGTQGSHPGPISFFLLAPVYRLMGSSAWGLQVSDAVLNLGVVAAAIWAAHRRLGLRGALLVAAGLAFLMRVYTPAQLVVPWNPYMPILFWFLFLACVWGVLCDDLVLLPVAVFAGTMCAQTHVPYVALVGGMALVVAGGLVLAWRRRDAAGRRSLLVWTGASLGLGVVLWAPVFIQQLGGNPGNLSILIDSFRHPSDPPIGLHQAGRWWLLHLDVFKLARGSASLGGSSKPGLVLVALWGGAAAVAVWLRERTLLALHVTVGAALALGLVAISRIFGPAWYYLMLWAWGTATLAAVAVIATGAAVVARALARRPDAARRTVGRLAWLPTAALAVLVLVPTVLSARSAPDTVNQDMDLSSDLGHLVGPTLRAVGDGDVPGAKDGPILVSWSDPYNLGGQGQGLMLELERHGYDARAGKGFGLAVRPHRTIDPADAAAELHLAVGPSAIADAARHPGGRRIASYDPRTPAQRASFDRSRSEVITGLQAAGLADMAAEVDDNFFGMATDTRLPANLRTAVFVMGRTRPPLAVYSWDPAP